MEFETERRYDLEGAVFEGWKEDCESSSPHRPFLGASDLGTECFRKAWYKYRHTSKPFFTGKLYRKFDRGHREEPVITKELQRVNVQIKNENKNGEQFEYTAFGGHVRVHLDGIGKVPVQISPDGTPSEDFEYMIFEMKTMSLKMFKTLNKKGIRETFPGYYRQMQTQWMVMKKELKDKFFITGVLFYAVCKDTDDLYISVVREDKEEQDLIEKEILNMLNGNAPDRVDVSPEAPPCRFCDFKMICRDHTSELIEKNCRTCDNARIVWDEIEDYSALTEPHWQCQAGYQFGNPCDHWTQDMRL